MGIKANFDEAGIEKYMANKMKLLETLIVRNLNYLGMKCVILARSLDTYTDRTGNLRNSIGYVIVKNGKVTVKNFEDDGVGGTEGKSFATSLAEEFPEGYALIVVAGMDYASYVEDIHHLDVLKPAKDMADLEIDSIAEGIVKSMSKSI